MRKLTLPFRVKKPILACGADLKGAFALAKGETAYLFDGFGDLADLDNFTRYERAVKEAIKKLSIRPEIVACDLHPGYFSTKFAESLQPSTFSAKGRSADLYGGNLQLSKVQHHEAHIASAIADNAIKGDVLGVAFDGTGYGLDGNIWGGEFFTGSAKKFKRVAHFDYIPMPGGDTVVKEPWRMAASYMYAAFGKAGLPAVLSRAGWQVYNFNDKGWSVLKDMIDKKINSPLTSSVGRLFDAVGSLVLDKKEARFEAELPIELEKIADANIDGYYKFKKTTDIIKGVIKDLDKGVSASAVSAKFHNTVAHLILRMAKRFGMKKVVLSGGVFQNKLLSKKAEGLLRESGFTVYTHSNVGTNDSGIPIGQIAIASERVSFL